jgi:hypothetical protein
MTETITSFEPIPASNLSVAPSDILLHLVVTLLAPMFVMASGGDILFARMAALETVSSYRARNPADLIAIAQIIACGLTALGSLGLSMADDLSLSMTLRLRSSAVALNRVAERNRRVLQESSADTARPAGSQQTAGDDFDATMAAADVAAMQPRPTATRAPQVPASYTPASHAPASHATAAAGAVPPPAAPISAASVTAERQVQAMWATAMTEVAGEFTASLPHLPPAARKMATVRAAALNSSAHALLSGTIPPRLGPGDLTAIMRSNPV